MLSIQIVYLIIININNNINKKYDEINSLLFFVELNYKKKWLKKYQENINYKLADLLILVYIILI
jgi:hypothetical protein